MNLCPGRPSAAIGRRPFIYLGAASLAGLLTACGSSSPSTQEKQSGEGQRTITDIEGQEVSLPLKPQRVITLSEPTLDAALALGITPLGSVAGRGQSDLPNYLKDRAKGVEILGSVSELNYEAIGALKPDLILADGTSINNRPDILEILRAIAPVVYCGYAGGPWERNFDYVAQALNLEAEGHKVKDDYAKKLASTKEELAPRYSQSTFSIVRWQGSGPSLILKELPAGQVLEGLGLKRPASQDRMGRGHSEPVSLENLASIDADYIFLGTLGGASQANPQAQGRADLAGAQEALQKAKETSGFTQLTAYQKDQILLVDGSLWTSTGGPLLLEGILEDVRKHLLP